MLIPRDLLEKYNTAVPRYTSYPPANFFEPVDTSFNAIQLLHDSNRSTTQNISIYLHIPFCPKLCLYCGCNTHITRDQDLMQQYVDALIKEIKIVAQQLDKQRVVTQIHWGGGTPNYLSTKQVEAIMQVINACFTVAEECEVAMECNPAYLDREYVDFLKHMGINRFSLGIQDFNTKVLQTVNRDASQLPVHELVDHLRQGKKVAVNLDFIYGLPYQDEDSFMKTIQQAIEINPDRLVTFSYAHVPWFKKSQQALEKHGLPTADRKLRLFEQAFQLLTHAGYQAIGLDHFAKTDDELYVALQEKKLHRNFQGYCTRKTTGQVYAFGASAISQLDHAYLQTTKDVHEYIERVTTGQLAIEKVNQLPKAHEIMREVINEIMCNQMLSWQKIADHFDSDPDTIRSFTAISDQKLNEFVQDGLIHMRGNEMHVTDTGRFFIRNIAAAYDPIVENTDRKFSKSI